MAANDRSNSTTRPVGTVVSARAASAQATTAAATKRLMVGFILRAFLVGAGLCSTTAQAHPATLQKGVSLGLFSEDAGWSYAPLLDEIRALGADHVQLVVALYQENGSSTELFDHPRFTAPREAIVRTIRQAHRRHLAVLLFPIVRLLHPRDGEWRGTLAPTSRAAWMVSYGSALDRLAEIAAAEKVEALSIGSELSTLDTDVTPWRDIVAGVRHRFTGELVYSANFDHYEKTVLFDLTSKIGMCAYFSLSDEGHPATQADVTARWQKLRTQLTALSDRRHQPLLLTEVGYLSQRGATAWPWREESQQPVDLDEQTRAYRAFVAAWKDAPPSLLGGVYFWNWYGWGGPHSGGYTPRGKPAAEVIRRFFAARAATD